jgi:hypothetical protein
MVRSHPCIARLRQLQLTAEELERSEILVAEGEIDTRKLDLFDDLKLTRIIREVIAFRQGRYITPEHNYVIV